MKPNFLTTLKTTITPLIKNVVKQQEKTKKNWCFHCATPWTVLSSDMKQVVRNLFEMRRAQYPSNEFVIKKCTNPGKNLNVLPRQECFNSYCQTLILTDHETGLDLINIRYLIEKT